MNEGVPGRWYYEHAVSNETTLQQEQFRSSSWMNRRSFWVQKEYLLGAIGDAGFDIVLEQYDALGPRIASAMTKGYLYRTDRNLFVGIKSP